MLNKILDRLKTITLWRLLWFSVILSELLTEIIVCLMSMLFYGRITYDYLITGGVAAFFVSLIVVAILVLLVMELRKNEKIINEQNRRLSNLSIKDELTAVYNYRHFRERLQEEVNRAARYSHPISLILVDVDSFKCSNDTHGHIVGDYILKSIVSSIMKNIRIHDVLARYGGDEFTIILPQTLKKDARDLAERIRSCIEEQPFRYKGSQTGWKLTVSLGVATFLDDADNPEKLIEMADLALYRAKKSGRNRVEVCNQ